MSTRIERKINQAIRLTDPCNGKSAVNTTKIGQEFLTMISSADFVTVVMSMRIAFRMTRKSFVLLDVTWETSKKQ